MTQAQTLQDIYLKIADIKDVLCEGLTSTDNDPITNLTTELTINETNWTTNGIQFSNPDNEAAITTAQTEINRVLTLALAVSQDERSSYDATASNAQGIIVPIPKGSPIMLLPKLLKILVLYKAPLKFLVSTILDFIEDILLDQIKRKLLEKKAEIFNTVAIASTKLIKIPVDAEQMVFSFEGLPDWLGKRFEPIDLNKSVIQPAPSPLPDLSKFNLQALGSVNFGLALTGTGSAATVYWGQDVRLDYKRQIVDIPRPSNFANYQRYGYVYVNYSNTLTIGFLRAT